MSEQTSERTAWRMRVMVVEDNAAAEGTIAELVSTAGHAVEVAADGPAAMKAAEANHADVVLLDLGLPGMDGWEIAKRLQMLPDPKRPLLVAVTGHGLEEDRRRSREVGIDLHLTKPVDAGQLLHLLGRFRSIISPPEEN